MRRVAALWPFHETDIEGQGAIAGLREELRELGWTDVRIESRWGGGDVERTRGYATELVGLSPDVMFAYFNAQFGPLSRETRTYRSCSWGRPIPSEPDMLRAWRAQVATSQASPFMSRHWRASGSLREFHGS